ncbi:hypothetical protein D917_08042 [Trichinella nativa]|uniref:Uncharacterized protein n=1 Tax=Trichinella nativa TaxID=6335 RepID=A0A1Y3EM69_9BILA|nr:hypothetical protein D917_08042 [Trichinella nativa]
MAKLQQHNNTAFFSCSNNVQLINSVKSPYHSWFKSGRSFDDQIIRQHQKTCHTKMSSSIRCRTYLTNFYSLLFTCFLFAIFSILWCYCPVKLERDSFSCPENEPAGSLVFSPAASV